MTRKRRKRKKIFLPKVQTTFCILSFIFILVCFIYYGNRLIKYYKIYNPKNEAGEVILNLSSKIIDSETIVTAGDGLYEVNGNYIYKGINVNNYILIDNILFRIIRINGDKTIDLVMDDYINKMEWNSTIDTYDNSSIKKYIESNVLSLINNDNLVKTSYCTDKVYELSEIVCNTVDNNLYIRLLGINDYLNSMNDSKTYMNSNDYIWLYNSGKNNVWHTTESYISNSSPTNNYGVKPVITLKNSVSYINGKGTIDNPYTIQKNNNTIKVGSYIDIKDNIYIVYEMKDNYLKVQSNKVLKDKMMFDTSSTNYEDSSIKKYLENTYL